DQNTAGSIAWAFGEAPTIIVLLVLFVQWARSDQREAKRKDRKADRDGDAELNDYNEYLAGLARRNSGSAA
ncbi:MAG TPA: cytochrome c oxidase assembly protein, partial [Actinospica sp.]|nr:cytochrome c oxidase assembly protein [Actinospica sp.]